MKKFVIFILFTVMYSGVTFSQDAVSIVWETKNRNQSDTMLSRSRMVITAKNGATTERVIDQYAKDSSNGLSRTVIVFQSPATVKGTRFLSMENKSGNTDQWIFLPSLGKVRRIAASEIGGNFMGTDFSYDDMSLMDRDINSDTHIILREETLNGSLCYVIQAIPKNTTSQYSKTISWIDKDNYRVYKYELYNKQGIVEKVMEIAGYRNIQGRDTATQITVSTSAAGTSTTIYMDIIKYDEPIPEGVFTTSYLESGRVR